MKTKFKLEPLKQEIFKLYKGGMCSAEIKEHLGLPCTARTIQRLLKKNGLSRSFSEAFKLAIKNGRKQYKKLGPGMGAKEFRKGISLRLKVCHIMERSI